MIRNWQARGARRVLAALAAAAALSLPLASASADPASAPARAFHAARSAPEKTLDNILRRAIRDPNIVEFVLATPHCDAKKDTGYAPLFSKPLLKALADAQAALVKHDCGGRYIEGEICGIDHDPILCGQDYPDKGYLFQTSSENRQQAIVSTQWIGGDAQEAHPLYRMARDGGSWKLDGVDCRIGAKFNMD
jgi:hypothetical protein